MLDEKFFVSLFMRKENRHHKFEGGRARKHFLPVNRGHPVCTVACANRTLSQKSERQYRVRHYILQAPQNITYRQQKC